MANLTDFSLNNLSTNPDFNLLNILSNRDGTNESDFFNDESPYETANLTCEYIDPVTYSTNFKNFANVSILSLNIQSLSAKFSDLKELISLLETSNCSPDVICLQEIWQISPYANFSLPGYSQFEYKVRSNNTQGGGVGIYVRNSIPYTVSPTFSIFSDRLFESIFVELTLPKSKSKLIIGSVYRPNVNHPNLSQSEQFSQSMELLSNLLSLITNSKSNVRILGDFNIDVLKLNSSNQAAEYIDLLFSFGLLQVITKPTRCTSNSATLLDHVLSNSACGHTSSFIMTSLISDHFPIIHHFDITKVSQPSPKIKSRDFSETNIQRFRETLQGINWSVVTDCPDTQTAYNIFSDIFLNFFELYFPLIPKKLNRNFSPIEPWFTKGLIVSRNNKLRLSKLAASSPSPANRSNFKTYRNAFNRVVRHAKKMFYERELIANQTNLKKTWELIRNAANLPKSNKECISQLLIDGVLTSDPLIIATKLNTFFTTMPSQIVDEIIPTDHPPDPDLDPLPDQPVLSFSDTPVTQNEVLEALKLLNPKKSQDFNDVSMHFLKKVFTEILIPYHHIIKTSLLTGVVPNQLKIAKIIPIFKSGDRTVMDNYRPISLLSNFSKILEKIVYRRLSEFAETNNILSPSQFGFRKNHSTVHPLVHFVNTVSSALNKKHHVIAIFCDLRKAFDTVDHKILLNKLKKIGVRGVELEWFRSYLSDRKQFVFVEGKCSPLLTILLGVPQGSILGPLLFLLYINDLPEASSLLSSLFADDTTLLSSGPDITELANFVNSELQKVVHFFRSHKLALHPTKTQYLLFSNSTAVKENPPSIYINNNEIGTQPDPQLMHLIPNVNTHSPIPAVKFLGIYIDPLLNFKYHVGVISKKLSRALFFLRTSKNFLTFKALKSLYYSLFHSNIIYGIQVWSCTAPSIFSEIEKKQKIAIRIVHDSIYNAHTEPLFKNACVLPLKYLIQFFSLQFMQQFIQGFLPSSFNNTWITNATRRQGENQVELRNADQIYIPFARLTSIERHPLTKFPRLWHEFTDESIKIIRDKLSFNKKLKEHFLAKLDENYSCDRLLCLQCHPLDRL